MNVAFNLPVRENALYRQEIAAAMQQVLDSGYYLLGQQVHAFEDEFAAFCGVKHCISVANGTDALEIGLRALGVQAGDEVVTVANAGGYSTAACNLIGAVPVYVDVEAGNLLLDLDQIVPALSAQTRCVIVTHLYGQSVDVQRLRSRLDDSGYGHIQILEDCAQAHGALSHGARVGSFGDVACFSFYPTKNLGALGDGGAIVTACADIHAACLQYRQYGWKDKYRAVVAYGRNSRLDELQAAILRVKLKHLPALNDKRRAACTALNQACRDDVDVVTRPCENHVAHLFVVRHPRRDAIRELLQEHGVASGIHYPVPDHQQPYMHQIRHRAMPLKQTMLASKEVFSLPCYAALEAGELEHIAMVFRQYIAGAEL